jgi:hypothetical protein
MENDFTDIKIIGLEEEMTVESPTNPALTYVFFRLSQTPPPLWTKHFKQSRTIARSPRWRHIWVDRRYLMIMECKVEEIEALLEEVKKDFAHSNQLYRQHLTHQTAAEQHKENQHLEQRDRLRDMKGRLNFD